VRTGTDDEERNAVWLEGDPENDSFENYNFTRNITVKCSHDIRMERCHGGSERSSGRTGRKNGAEPKPWIEAHGYGKFRIAIQTYTRTMGWIQTGSSCIRDYNVVDDTEEQLLYHLDRLTAELTSQVSSFCNGFPSGYDSFKTNYGLWNQVF
jgi:hypothetical protein